MTQTQCPAAPSRIKTGNVVSFSQQISTLFYSPVYSLRAALFSIWLWPDPAQWVPSHGPHNKTVSNNTFLKSFSLTFQTTPALSVCILPVGHQRSIELTNKPLYGNVVLFRCKAESKALMHSRLHGPHDRSIVTAECHVFYHKHMIAFGACVSLILNKTISEDVLSNLSSQISRVRKSCAYKQSPSL